ncbi:MAG: Rieske (2Fe-2S) protein [Flavobacteriales bacterium]|nr:MAG: Rieske (2Fe-2S) protein [Flavobacteriales bacterium]
MLVERMVWYRWPGRIPSGIGAVCPGVISGRKLLLVRWNDHLYALEEQCPHHGASMIAGEVNDGCLVCPRHRYRYDLVTGRGRQPDGGNAAVYPIEVRHGGVFVGVSKLTLRLFGRDLW